MTKQALSDFKSWLYNLFLKLYFMYRVLFFLSRKGLRALLRHLRYFPGPYIARELNMQRDVVEELAMRGLENLDQYEQTNRHYVLAAEGPKPISPLLRRALLQNYQLVEWAYTEKFTIPICHQLRSLPVKWRQWYVHESFDWAPPKYKSLCLGNYVETEPVNMIAPRNYLLLNQTTTSNHGTSSHRIPSEYTRVRPLSWPSSFITTMRTMGNTT